MRYTRQWIAAAALIGVCVAEPSTARAQVVIDVAAGGFHSAMIRSDGTVWNWGMTAYGILSDNAPYRGARTTSLTDMPVETAFSWPYRYCLVPIQVVGEENGALTDIRTLSAGQHFTLALAADGTVWGWGSNDFGQLGDGSEKPSESFYLSARERSTPARVVGPGGQGLLTDVTAVSAGYQHALALRADGTVWAWGDNSAGQLGDGGTDERSEPVQAQGPDGDGVLREIIAIAAGSRHNLALRRDGTVWAWGSNGSGQLGDGTREERHVPVQVPDLSGVTAISAGTASSLALFGDGTVRAWGSNAFGQIGDGTREDRTTPETVKGIDGVGVLSGIASIVAGRTYAAAVTEDAEVLVWGFHEGGLRGNGTLEGSLTPALVAGPDGEGVMRGVTRIAAGSRHLLALREDGTVWSWGSNLAGQLGDVGATEGLTPVRVRDLPDPPDVSHGEGRWLPSQLPIIVLPGTPVPLADGSAVRYRVRSPVDRVVMVPGEYAKIANLRNGRIEG